MSNQRILGAFALGALLVAGAAGAETGAPEPETPDRDPWRRAELSIGCFFTSLDSEVRVGAKALGVAANLDLEKFLTLEETTSVVRAGASWRIAGRHRLSFDYYDLSREATNRLEVDISFGDRT